MKTISIPVVIATGFRKTVSADGIAQRRARADPHTSSTASLQALDAAVPVM
ncbi:MAG: hypothetical protein IPP38_08235 [Bacteroidetes bacterium]|nr:hypothetical protein [Bacteroidota bacterium]